MLIGHVLLLSCYRKKLQNLFHLNCGPKYARFESSWLHNGGLLQDKVYKIRITDLNELKRQLRMEWAKLDHVVIAAAICQWRR